MDKDTSKYIKIIMKKASKTYGVISYQEFDEIVPTEHRKSVMLELHNNPKCTLATHGMQFV